jgi:hypothetical protein
MDVVILWTMYTIVKIFWSFYESLMYTKYIIIAFFTIFWQKLNIITIIMF